MPPAQYLTAPRPISTVPPGIPFIVANEAAERFSYYGMRGILTAFMANHLLSSTGAPDPMSRSEAASYFHLFGMAVYFFPFLGAILADAYWGKYRTIFWLSIVYCLGHLALAIDETRVGLAIGLGLIAIGAGGIKPCVSAHVGDQFGKSNHHLLEKVYGWFYFSINVGSFVSSLLTPWLLAKYGPHVAFGVPGVLMALATLFFWLGRYRFVHIPPAGPGYFRETFTGEGLRTLARLVPIYLFVAMFWALYDQTGSTWVLQAENMDRRWLGHDWLPSQVQAVNPILILLFIPLFAYVIYPALNKVVTLTPLRKMAIGFLVTPISFAICAWVEQQIVAGERPTIAWQLLAYVFITAAEVMVSITSLEFSYTQAPPKMKSIVMATYFLSVSLGNSLASFVNAVNERDDHTLRLTGPQYFWFFAGAMLVSAVLFLFVLARYKPRTYLQTEQPAPVV